MKLLLLLLLIPKLICGGEEIPPFFLITLPKSGTHLMCKALKLLTARTNSFLVPIRTWKMINVDPDVTVNYSNFITRMQGYTPKKTFPYVHLNYSNILLQFVEDYPKWRPILMIRDLRDMFVSAVHYYENEIYRCIKSKDKKTMLIYLMTVKDVDKLPKGFATPNFERLCKEADIWMEKEGVFVCRFEDLVGPQGGGDFEVQKQVVRDLSAFLNIVPKEDRLEQFCKSLFGSSITFRKGQIGSNATYFDDEVQAVFDNSIFSHFQTKWGYPVQ